ncbi:MAG: hypothetical protein ACREBU_21030, partial [Nitrososphaera sp.]
MKSIFWDSVESLRLDQVDPTSILEKDFKKTVTRLLKKLYPLSIVFPFEPVVIQNNIGWKPDLALVNKAFEFWYVIEVETILHSLQKHVIPQVIAFRDGIYGEDAALTLSKNLNITVDQARTFIKHVPRYVGVVANHDEPAWQQSLSSENIQFVSITEFAEISGQKLDLVHGALNPAERSIGFGQVLATSRAIRVPIVHSAYWSDGEYRIADPGGTGEWTCTIEDNVAWLMKKRGVISLPDQSFVQFIKQDSSVILMRPI